MSEYKRIKCPECNNVNPRKLHEEPDKNSVLYYITVCKAHPFIKNELNVEIAG